VVCAAYDFSTFHTLVDVGGGTGYFLAAILQANPTLRGILLDQPQIVEQARLRMKAEGLEDRCQVVGGDFFSSVPPGGDGYTIKGALFNWDDERATQILANCRKAMKPRGRVLVIESVMPSGNAPSPAKVLDIEMLVGIDGGVARTESEFRALFARAGLKVSRILSLPSLYSVIEGVAE
jgi:ubiquinone/menaquinone biosynthesis C-methylase UbiE